MLSDQCKWDHPGADRYVGTIPAAIAAYGLPLATQSALIAAWESRQFSDHVVIDRTDIRGQTHDYAPVIREMHFGSRGRVCESVSRSGWSAEHVETAIVLCADDECVAIPAVCSNVFRLTRVVRATDRPADDGGGDVVVAPDVPLGGPLADPVAPSAATPADESSFARASSTGWLPFGTPGIAGAPSTWLMPSGQSALIPAVAEPPTLVMLALGGLGLVAWRKYTSPIRHQGEGLT